MFENISVNTVITVVVILMSTATLFGSMRTSVKGLQSEDKTIHGRISHLAQTTVQKEVLNAKMDGIKTQLEALRREGAQGRREIMDRLDRGD